jgi:hypothetical protein
MKNIKRLYLLQVTLLLVVFITTVESCFIKKHADNNASGYFGMYRSNRNIEGGFFKECLLIDSNFVLYYILDSSDYCAKKNEFIRRDYVGTTNFTIRGDSIRFQFDSLANTRSKGSFYRNGELITVYSKQYSKKIHQLYYGKYTHDTLHLTLQTIDLHYKDTTFQKITYVKCR